MNFLKSKSVLSNLKLSCNFAETFKFKLFVVACIVSLFFLNLNFILRFKLLISHSISTLIFKPETYLFVCFQEFTSNVHLKLHMVNHLTEPKRTDKLTFFCKICKQTVTSHDTLSHHIIITNTDLNKPASYI